jgi:hypothetical protein
MRKGPLYRIAQLEALIDALQRFIPLVTQNHRSQWVPQLEYCRRFAQLLNACGSTHDDLDDLFRQIVDTPIIRTTVTT